MNFDESIVLLAYLVIGLYALYLLRTVAELIRDLYIGTKTALGISDAIERKETRTDEYRSDDMGLGLRARTEGDGPPGPLDPL
jgi:hypothetical protein